MADETYKFWMKLSCHHQFIVAVDVDHEPFPHETDERFCPVCGTVQNIRYIDGPVLDVPSNNNEEAE